MVARIPELSKSRYQKGLQCHRQLWLECFRKELADPLDERTRAVFEVGHRVGGLARRRYPEGVLVDAGYREGARALRQARQLISAGATTLFEAAFDGDGVFVRVDILRQADDGRWDLIEVKQSSRVKDEHVSDAAVQVYSAERAGLRVRSASIMHVDTSYVWEGGPYDPQALFALEDITDRVQAHLDLLPAYVEDMRRVLAGPCPERRFGRHCRRPYDCAFLGHCRSSLPEFPVTDLPWITDDQLTALQDDGILSVFDVPVADPRLQARQRTICRVAAEERVRFGEGLRSALGEAQPPLFFLDFETAMSALPLFPRTRPYQVVPIQWSLHRWEPGGRLDHWEHLHEGSHDPRPELVQGLLRRLGSEGSVVVYSSFEKTRLEALAQELPEYARSIDAVRDRLFDLEPVVRHHVQHHGFRGRSSLKYVLPALVPDLAYDDLAIQDGVTAMARYEAAIRRVVEAGGGVDGDRAGHATAQGSGEGNGSGPRRTYGASDAQLFADLRAYCARDTLGLCRVYQHLAAQAGLN